MERVWFRKLLLKSFFDKDLLQLLLMQFLQIILLVRGVDTFSLKDNTGIAGDSAICTSDITNDS